MSKFTWLVLCVVAATLYGVDAKFSDTERASIGKAVTPIVAECAKENGHTVDEAKQAQAASNVESLNPCFFACAFKKAGILNDEGQFNGRSALDRVLEKHVTDLSEYQNKSEKCASVNDKPTSDGTAGCERATQVLDCLFKGQGVELVLS